MPKIEIPANIAAWFRANGIDKLLPLLEVGTKIQPVFLVNPEGYEGYVRDPYRSYVHQEDEVFQQLTPGTGTKYTILDTTENVRLITGSINCTWTVQPTPLEFWLTIDGVSVRFFFNNPVSTTNYHIGIVSPHADDQLMSTTVRQQPFILEGASIKIEGEITGGTVSSLDARIKYATLP